MDNWIIEQRVDLRVGVPQVQTWPQALMLYGDAQAHTWRVRVLDAGRAAELTGTVAAYFVRQDGQTVLVAGTVTGNICEVVLPQACYAVKGEMRAVMRLSSGNTTMTLAVVTLRVGEGVGDSIIDPGEAIPMLDALLARIAEMEQGTMAANSAANNANSAIANLSAATVPTAEAGKSVQAKLDAHGAELADHTSQLADTIQYLAESSLQETTDNPAILYTLPGSKIAISVVDLGSNVNVIHHGKNWFNKSEAAFVSNATFTLVSGAWYIAGASSRAYYVTAAPNTQYTVSKIGGDRFRVAISDVLPAQTVMMSNVITNNDAESITITTGPNTKYIVMVLNSTNSAIGTILDTLMIEVGDTASEYEQYYGSTETLELADGKGDYVFDSIPGMNVVRTTADTMSIIYTMPLRNVLQKMNDDVQRSLVDISIFNNAYIRDCMLVCNPVPKIGESYVAKYSGIDLGNGNTPSKMRCRAKFARGSSGGSIALVSNPVGLTRDYHITTKSLHCVFADIGARIGLMDNYVETVALQYIYGTPLARDAETEYTFGVEIDGTTVTLICPDGTFQSQTIVNIADYVGRYCTLEHFGNTAAMSMPMFTFYEIRVDGKKTVWDYFKRPDGAIGVSPSGHTYVQINTIDD